MNSKLEIEVVFDIQTTFLFKIERANYFIIYLNGLLPSLDLNGLNFRKY